MIKVLICPCESIEKQSALARNMLFSELREEFSLPETEIKKTADGKPYFEEKGYPAFSISHTAGAVCVAIFDGAGSIGADIEKCSERLLNKRLTDRFFPGLTKADNSVSDIEIKVRGEVYDAEPEKALFTLGEAVIKCDGRGFSAAGEAYELIRKMKTSSFKIILSGEEYALSVAVLIDEEI